MISWKRFIGVVTVMLCGMIGANVFASNIIAELEYYYAKDGTV